MSSTLVHLRSFLEKKEMSFRAKWRGFGEGADFGRKSYVLGKLCLSCLTLKVRAGGMRRINGL